MDEDALREGDITRALIAHREGDKEALERLLPIVYDDLRRIARRSIGPNRTPTQLDTVGLVNEAYLRLVDQTRAEWNDRGHFFRVAATAIRQILIDSARRRNAVKRGGGKRPETLNEEITPGDDEALRLLALDEALTTLGGEDERLMRVVECRFFGGLTEEETADALDVSVRTVQREWKRARERLKELMS